MEVTVRLFGSIREAVGTGELVVELEEGASAETLRKALAQDVPAFETAGTRLAIAVNRELVKGDCILKEGDEVAFLPPVAGGAQPRAVLSEKPLDVASVVARVSGEDAGGLVTFVGTVRSRSRGHDIKRLEYEAYAGMAERELERICDEAVEQNPGARVAVAHRTGQLAVGDIAVVVAVAAPHRDGAFAACRYTIDVLKQRVPIWKKEITTEGDYWVEDTP